MGTLSTYLQHSYQNFEVILQIVVAIDNNISDITILLLYLGIYSIWMSL